MIWNNKSCKCEELLIKPPCYPRPCQQGFKWNSRSCKCEPHIILPPPNLCQELICAANMVWNPVKCQCEELLIKPPCIQKLCSRGFKWSSKACKCVPDLVIHPPTFCKPKRCQHPLIFNFQVCDCINLNRSN
jgi:hypothetical protein